MRRLEGRRIVVTGAGSGTGRAAALRFAIEGASVAVLGRADGHVCQMYRWRQLEALISGVGAEVLAASASNWASLGEEETAEAPAAEPAAWSRFLEHEVAACREPGLLDAGTHILFAATRDGELAGVLRSAAPLEEVGVSARPGALRAGGMPGVDPPLGCTFGDTRDDRPQPDAPPYGVHL